MNKIRCLYTKTGRAKFISHLDLMATLKRSFLRAGVELSYSEGFNPHPYISVALPLSVGCESVCELADVGFSGKEFPRNVNHFLPEGLSISEVYSPTRKFSHIKWIKVICTMHFANGYEKKPEIAAQSIKALFSNESIVISKKSKSGIKDIDVAPHIKCGHVRVLSDFAIEIGAVISAQNPTVSHNDFLSVIGLDDKIQVPSHFFLKRIEIYDESMIEFR